MSFFLNLYDKMWASLKKIIKKTPFLYKILSLGRQKYHGAWVWYGEHVLIQCKHINPCIIVSITGGLGNQIWLYAIGSAASKTSGLPVKYDLSWYEECGKDINGLYNRQFDLLHVFPLLALERATRKEVRLYRKCFSHVPQYMCVFDENVFLGERARYLGGFYANAQYLKILDLDFWNQFIFALPLDEANLLMRNAVNAAVNSVAVHIRRGDYVGSVHDVVGLSYYQRAFEFFEKKFSFAPPVFFIFSNDMEWARNSLANTTSRVVFVEHNDNDNGAMDMYLMTQCRHHIISNSTFSWLAAWLCKYQDKRIIMPDRWFTANAPESMSKGNEDAFYVEGYIKIPCGSK